MARPDPLRWWVLVAALTAVLPVGLDTSLVTVALPAIRQAQDQQRPAVVLAILPVQLLALGLLLPIGRRAAERLGRRRVLLCGLGVLGAAAVAAACSPSAPWLVAARLLMGAAGAAVLPAALAALEHAFAPEERGRAVAVWAAGTGLLVAFGPLMAGLLLSRLYWGSVFVLQGGCVLLALVLVARLVPESRAEPDGRTGLRAPRRAVAPGEAAGAVAAAVLLGTTVDLSLWLQDARGRTPLQTALVLLPAVISVGVGPRAAALSRRWGGRTVTVGGLLAVALTSAAFALLASHGSSWLAAALLALLACGATAATTAGLGAAPAQRSGSPGAARLLGGAWGVALMGGLVVTQYGDGRAALSTGFSRAALLGAATATAAAVVLLLRGRGAAAPAPERSGPRARASAR